MDDPRQWPAPPIPCRLGACTASNRDLPEGSRLLRFLRRPAREIFAELEAGAVVLPSLFVEIDGGFEHQLSVGFRNSFPQS